MSTGVLVAGVGLMPFSKPGAALAEMGAAALRAGRSLCEAARGWRSKGHPPAPWRWACPDAPI